MEESVCACESLSVVLATPNEHPA